MPRQNVILELGYFIGKLRRDHVVALLKGELELVYVNIDGDNWRDELAKERRETGIAAAQTD